MAKSLSDLSREYDLSAIRGAEFPSLVRLAHDEGLLLGVLEDAGIVHLYQALPVAVSHRRRSPHSARSTKLSQQ